MDRALENHTAMLQRLKYATLETLPFDQIERRLKAVLQSVLADPWLEALLQRASSPHPAGFDRLMLSPNLEGNNLRLHHWADGSLSKGDVHSHRWDFVSVVLKGEVFNETYQKATGQPAERYEVLAHGSTPDGGSELVPDGSLHLEQPQLARIAAGDRYRMSYRQLHRSYCQETTTTLLAEGPLASETTFVCRRPGDGQELREAEPYSPQRFRSLVASVEASLPD